MATKAKTAKVDKEDKVAKVAKVYGILQQPKTIEEWIAAKKKNPNKFGYTPEGDLVLSPVRQGEDEKVLVIPKYVPASTGQIQEFFKKRAQEITEPQEQFALAKQGLRKVVEAYKNGQMTALDVKNANQQTKDADALLNSKYRYPLYYTMNDSMLEYDLTFTDFNRIAGSKFADPVFQAGSTPFPFEAFWVPASQAEVVEEFDANEGDEATNEKEKGEQQPQQGGKRPLSHAAIAIINKRRMAMKRF
jgi:hypothetical protein